MIFFVANFISKISYPSQQYENKVTCLRDARYPAKCWGAALDSMGSYGSQA